MAMKACKLIIFRVHFLSSSLEVAGIELSCCQASHGDDLSTSIGFPTDSFRLLLNRMIPSNIPENKSFWSTAVLGKDFLLNTCGGKNVIRSDRIVHLGIDLQVLRRELICFSNPCSLGV